MFDYHKFTKECFGTVGMRQNDNPDFPKLSQNLLHDGTNILIHHPLINIENLDMTSRNYSKYADYEALTSYNEGDVVQFNSLFYRSILGANTGNQPDLNPGFWEETNLLSLYIEDIYRDSFAEVAQQVFQRKKLHRNVKKLLSNQKLTSGSGGFNDTILNESSLVGIEFRLTRNQNVRAVIDRVGLQLSAAQANPLTLYLYHSSQLEPIAQIAVNHVKTHSFQWHVTNFVLNNMTDEHDTGGTFYLMYDQNDLTGQAIRKKQNFNKPPCQYCNKNETEYFNRYSKFLHVRTVEVKTADRNAENGLYLWDLDNTKYVSDNNFGINLEFTIQCDLTEFILRQKEVFVYGFRDMIVKKMLESMSLSTRKNSLETRVQELARAELQSQKIGGMGFIEKVDRHIKEIDFEISELDDMCMPCNRRGGISHSTAGLSIN